MTAIDKLVTIVSTVICSNVSTSFELIHCCRPPNLLVLILFRVAGPWNIEPASDGHQIERKRCATRSDRSRPDQKLEMYIIEIHITEVMFRVRRDWLRKIQNTRIRSDGYILAYRDILIVPEMNLKNHKSQTKDYSAPTTHQQLKHRHLSHSRSAVVFFLAVS